MDFVAQIWYIAVTSPDGYPALSPMQTISRKGFEHLHLAVDTFCLHAFSVSGSFAASISSLVITVITDTGDVSENDSLNDTTLDRV